MCSFIFKLFKKKQKKNEKPVCLDLVLSQRTPIFNYLIYKKQKDKKARNKK